MPEISYHIATQKRPVPVREHRRRALPSQPSIEVTMTSSNVNNSREVWKPVVGYEGSYEVSSRGRIRSLDRYRRHMGGGTALIKGRVLRLNDRGRGYLWVGLCQDGSTKHFVVHRLVARSFIGPRPRNHQVNHKNLVKSDNRPGNLEYLTQKENMAHASINGAMCCGEENPASKLTEEQVQQILRQRASGVPRAEVASSFGIVPNHVTAVTSGRVWAHVDCEGVDRSMFKGIPLGERRPEARLTESDVRHIVRKRARGEQRSAVADQYNVAPSTISDITRGRTWTHVTGL